MAWATERLRGGLELGVRRRAVLPCRRQFPAGDVAAAGDDPRRRGVARLGAVLPRPAAVGPVRLAPAGRGDAAPGLGGHGPGRRRRRSGQPPESRLISASTSARWTGPTGTAWPAIAGSGCRTAPSDGSPATFRPMR